jgi:hypothetical protein
MSQQLQLVYSVPCLFCQGTVSPAGEAWACDLEPGHTMRPTAEGVAVWTDGSWSLPQPSPLPATVTRPCRFCGGNMVPTREQWTCSQDFRHQLKVWGDVGIWQSGYQAPVSTAAPAWPKGAP